MYILIKEHRGDFAATGKKVTEAAMVGPLIPQLVGAPGWEGGYENAPVQMAEKEGRGSDCGNA